MAAIEKLQIKLLSASGELLKVVNCHAGQITVLRAYAPGDLMPYQRALSGIPGPERFVVSVDSESYDPKDHCLIGFGERFGPGSGTVRELLLDAGLPEGALSSTLLSYGLEGLEGRECQTLSNDQERRVRLLAGAYSSDKVLIFHNPFDPVSVEWRERFAELILHQTHARKMVVLITSLSFRPECWIGNEMIARTQVGENLQRTIGFSSDASDMKQIVSEVRKIFGDESKVKEILKGAGAKVPDEAFSQDPEPIKHRRATTTKPPIAPAMPETAEESPKEPPPGIFGSAASMTSPRQKEYRPSPVLWVALILSAGFMGAAAILTRGPSEPPPTQIAAIATPAETVVVEPTPVVQPPTPKPVTRLATPTPFVRLPTPKPQQTPAKVVTALEIYPTEIRRAVLQAIEGRSDISTGSSSPVTRREPKASSKDKSKDNFELLKMLENANDTGKDTPSRGSTRRFRPTPANYPPPSSMSVEERREMIRKRFLEAIEKAADRQR